MRAPEGEPTLARRLSPQLSASVSVSPRPAAHVLVVTVLCWRSHYTVVVNERRATFIVRLTQVTAGTWTGVVERVRTGEKHRVHELTTIGNLIARMVATEEKGLPEGTPARRNSP